MSTIVIACALGIIVLLAAIAAYYVGKLYFLNKKQRKSQQKHKAHSEAKIKKSVYILAKSLLAEQVPLAEAALRISALVEGLDIEEDDLWLYVSFQKLAQGISHIPILEGWQKLSKHQRDAYRLQIAEQEEKYKEFIVKAAAGLVEKHAV
ncbi:MAG: DUF2489 domain-containing protein [Cellvibrionaceae bacterium]|nr:DUF2489 domain-containing protein [Cellvibrionaceae bacterium]